MKKHLLIFTLLPGSLNTWKQTTTGVQAQVLQKEKPGAKFNNLKLLAMVLLVLFISLCSTVAIAQQQTFYSGGTFTVPPGVTSVTISGVGGAGGSGGQDCGNGCGYNPGASGGYTSGTYSVSPGTSLSITIGSNGGNGGSNVSGGGAGSGGSGYYSGGRGGNTGSTGASGGGGGGGGATAVIGSGVTLIAGGGGGGGGRCNTSGSGTAGSTSTGGSGSTSGAAGGDSGDDGAGGGGGGGGVSGGSGGGHYALNGEWAAYGGNSGSSSPGGSTSSSTPYAQISYTAVGGSASASPSAICSGSSSTISLSGYAGYISWYYSTDGSNYYYYGSSAESFNTGTLTSNRYYKALISGTTWSSVATVSIYALTSAPSSANSTGTTQSTASLSWGAGSGNGTITYYWVVGTSSGVNYPGGSGAYYGSTTGTTASATGLSPNTAYYLRVYASATCGNSGYQTSAAFTTVPVAPVANTETNVRANSFTANWTASTSGASGYYLDISTSPTFANYVSGYQNRNVGNVSSYSLTGLNRYTTYYYRVRGYNAGGSSLDSNTISFTTLPLNNFLIEKVGGGSIGTQMAGQAFSIRITARDAFNTTITDYTGSSAAAISTNSVLTSGGTTANFIAGILASHSVTLTLSGDNKTLTAAKTDGVTSVTSTSTTFTVTSAALDHFSLAVDGIITAGIPFTVTATAYDVYNNIKANYGGASDVLNFTGTNNVSWTTTAISSPKGTARIIAANGNQPFTNGISAGITGFTFFNSDQTQLTPFTSPTITISDGPTAKQGTTDPIVVKNNVLDNLKVVSGTKQTANTPFDVTVTARDIYWNTCIDYTGSIRFKTSDDLLVTFPSGLQPYTVSDKGVRTFSTINIEKVGAYWLRAADSQFAYKSGQQENIVVEPGAFLKSAPISTVTVDYNSRIAGEYVIVTVIPHDAMGNLLYSCQELTVWLDNANIGEQLTYGTTPGSEGIYTFRVKVTSTTAANIISAKLSGVAFDQTQDITVYPAAPSLAHSILTPDAGTMTTDGNQLITFQLKDKYDNNRTTNDGIVTFNTNLGGFSGNNGNQTIIASYDGGTSGSYRATLYASYNAVNNGVGLATIDGSIAFNEIAGQGVTDECPWPANGAVVDKAGVTITEGLPFLSTIDISSNPGVITTNGTSLISVQLKDQLGNLITNNRGTIALSTPLGTLSAVTYISGGVYQSTLSGYNPGFGPTTITGTYNSSAITDNAVVTFNEGLPNLAHITISASKSPMTTDENSTITVQLKDVFDNDLTTSRGTITLISSIGSLSSVTDNNNGTYTATLIGDSRGFGNATITGKLDNADITHTATVSITQGLSSLTVSTISASKSPMTTDETSIITVQLKDQWGNNLTTSRGTVLLSTTLGALTAVTDNSNGTYTATLSGNNTGAGTATITGSLSGAVTGAYTDDASVIINEGLPVLSKIQITANPTSITADQSSIVTIQLKDQWENNLTTSRGAITLATAPIGHLSSVTDNGNGSYTATFSLTAFGTGTATITGNFTGSGTASGVSGAVTDNATIDVAHGVAAKLTVLTQPSATATAGVIFAQQPAVRIEDQFGNLVNNDNTTVLTAARSTGSDVLKGTLTATATNGIATFTNLFYTKAESITLGYTSNPALTTTSSSSILVGHAPASYFTLNSPADFIAGATRAAYTVTRYDEFANLVTTNAQTVYLTNSSTGLNKKFYNAASAGSVITQLTIANGASSANFWYYDEKTGIIDVVASENTPADGNTGIDDAVDQIIVKPTVLKDFIVQDVPDPHDLGTWQSVKVIARDSYDNIKTNYVGKVTFSNTDLTAVNPADYQFQLSDLGVHVFVNAVKFSQTGNWWLTALDWNDPSKYGAQPDITVQRAVRLTANARTKTYGNALTLGTTEFSLAAIVTGFDPIPGDITGVTLTSNGAVNTANAGDYNITPSNATGPHADLYRVVYVDGTLTVNKKPLTITSPTIASREYNATQTAGSVTVGTLSGFISGKEVSATAIAADYSTPNVGTYDGVVVTYTLIDGTGLASNYSLANGTATGVITPKVLSISAPTIASKVYNATATAGAVTVGTLSGFVPDETVTATAVAANYTSANVGTYPNDVVTYTLVNGNNGGLATNYSLATGSATGEITQKALTIGAPTIASKVYNATATAGAVTVGTLSGFVPDETVTATAVAANYTSANVGTYPNDVVTYTLVNGNNGGLATNYSLATGSATGEITQKALTIGAPTIASKVYNASATAGAVTVGTLSGFVPDETVTATAVAANYTSANVGTYPNDVVTYTLVNGNNGGLATNYSLATGSATGEITQKALTIGAPTIASKVYNATATAGAVTVGTLSGFVPDETVTATAIAANYTSANVGTYPNDVVTYTLVNGNNGGLATNYSLATGSATGEITQKALTIGAPTIASKVYNASATAGAVTVGTLSGFVPDETVTATAVAANYTSANVGAYPNDVVTYTLVNGNNGGLATNYSLATGSATGEITQKALTIGAPTIASKVYNASATAGTVTVGTLSGFVPDETVTATAVAANYTSANVGTYPNDVVTYTLVNGNNGGLATNYSLATGTATGEITQANLTVTAIGPAKAYGTVLATGFSTTNFTAIGMAGSELVSSVTLTPNAAGLSSVTLPEAAYVVTPSLATGTGGFIASNYNITYTAYNGTVSKKVLTVTAVAKSKTYDGSVFTPFTSTITGFVNDEIVTDIVTGIVTYTGTATTAVNPGTYVITPVIIGLSATNYTFVSVNGSLNIWDLEIVDTTPPSWVTASIALNRTIEYGDAVGLSATQLLLPVAVDANSFVLTKVSGELVKAQDCIFGGTYTNTWTAKDSYGNISSVYKQVITIVKTYNDQPKIDQVQDFSVYKNSKQVEVTLSGIDPASNCTPQEIASLIAVADNSLLITEILVNYSKGNSTGKLVLKIADNLLGESLIRVTLKDNGGVANGAIDTQEISFKVKVVGEDQGPKLTSQIPILIINPGNSFEVNLNNYFSNQNNNPVTYTATLANGTLLPSWMVFNPLTGIISGVAPQNDLGSYQIFVTATDSQGLTTQTSFWLINTTAGTSVVSGNISSIAGSVTDGIQVILLKIGTNNQTTIVEKIDLNGSSSFTFSELSSGTYLLNAVVTDVVKHPDLLNTYYTGSSTVFNAQRIVIGSQNNTGIQLQMLQKTPVTSNGSISGLVIRKVTPATPGNDQIGQLASDVDIVLKQDGKIVANTLTNLDGKYSFNSLPEGTYYVEAEQLGYTLEVVKKVTIGANYQNAVDVNFTIWTSGTITEVEDLAAAAVINMYPNPTSGQLNIVTSKDGYTTITVFTTSGKEVFRKNYLSGEAIKIDLSNQVSGIYFVKLESEGESVTKKIILKK